MNRSEQKDVIGRLETLRDFFQNNANARDWDRQYLLGNIDIIARTMSTTLGEAYFQSVYGKGISDLWFSVKKMDLRTPDMGDPAENAATCLSLTSKLLTTLKSERNIQGELTNAPYAPYWFLDILDGGDEQYIIKPAGTESFFILDGRSGLIRAEAPLAGQRFFPHPPYEYHHMLLHKSGNKIIISPYYEQRWLIYDVRTTELDVLTCPDAARDMPVLVRGARDYDGSTYFWNARGELFSYTPGATSVAKVADFPAMRDSAAPIELPERAPIRAESFYRGRLYIPWGSSGGLAVMDLGAKSLEMRTVGAAPARYVSTATDGEYLWLVKDTPDLVRYSPETGDAEEIPVVPNLSDEREPYFIHAIYTGDDRLLLFPNAANKMAEEVVRYSPSHRHMDVVDTVGGYESVKRLHYNCIAAINCRENTIDFYDDDGIRQRTVYVDFGKKLLSDWSLHPQQ